eukprot:803469-Pelagomonas_calceolata.AAC.1
MSAEGTLPPSIMEKGTHRPWLKAVSPLHHKMKEHSWFWGIWRVNRSTWLENLANGHGVKVQALLDILVKMEHCMGICEMNAYEPYTA